MSPSKGSSEASPYRLGSICMLAGRQSVHLAALALSPILMAVCGAAVHAQTTAVGDRYSGEIYVQPAYRQAAEPSEPTLSWPGKAAPAPLLAAPQLPSPSPAASQTTAYQAPAYPAPAYPSLGARAQATQARSYGPPPVMPWYQRYGAVAAPSAPSTPAPQSIYDPPAGQAGVAAVPSIPASRAAAAAPPAPVPTAANDGETARFYSLHRQYGLTPDPDPIPPQFFTQTADLSEPPGPSPVYKAASSASGSTTAVHPVQADDPTSTLGQP
jgi:hypothetical protein